ncbi:hypothetical protein ABIA39_000345 [Nocardia sp. GAS34]
MGIDSLDIDEVALPAPVRGMGSFPLRAIAWTDHGGAGS